MATCLGRVEHNEKSITLVNKQGKEHSFGSMSDAEVWLGRRRGYISQVSGRGHKAFDSSGNAYAVKQEERQAPKTPPGSPLETFERLLMEYPRCRKSMSAEEFVDELLSGLAINARLGRLREEMDRREIPPGRGKECSKCGVVRDREIDFRSQGSECKLCEAIRDRMDNRVRNREYARARRAAGD